MGPITIFDKSALQALSVDESVWLEAYFLSNVTPLFYVETLADLEKAVAEGRTAEHVVASLAEKTPSDAYPNVHHRTLIEADLRGQEIEMTGRIMVAAGEYKRAPDGTLGMHIDEFPEAVMLLRWKNQEFNEAEREVARRWREELATHEPERMIAILQNTSQPGQGSQTSSPSRRRSMSFARAMSARLSRLPCMCSRSLIGRRQWCSDGGRRLETVAGVVRALCDARVQS
jgi:hypothetical protein